MCSFRSIEYSIQRADSGRRCYRTWCIGYRMVFSFRQKDKKQSEKKSLIKLKDKDVFYYHYDLVEPLHFKINVGLSDEIDTPKCIKTVGKNLYEGLSGLVEDKYQSSVDTKWINECLSYYNEDKKKEFYYEIKNRVKELSQIRYFQDYMHNQIVQIHLPQNRIVYMACDATEDVILNFHINSNKLLEYTSINQKSVSQSVIKYHDCIELCMMKKTFIDQKTDFDFSVGNYGVFLSYANQYTKPFNEVSIRKEYFQSSCNQPRI